MELLRYCAVSNKRRIARKYRIVYYHVSDALLISISCNDVLHVTDIL